MCQDTAYSVRKQMAEELPEIAIAIGYAMNNNFIGNSFGNYLDL